MQLKDIRRKELIGREVELVDSTNKDNIGIKGKIINETKHTFIIKQSKTKKTIMKNNTTLKIKMNNKNIIIKGKSLVGRPEDRIQKRL